ncbi:MAG: VOC family protein [Bacteroidetes bacterium]|nr:MAG: VOC family protein [Bacteroidota bacterium]
MKLGAFSISLSVKDLQASKAFYEKLGFSVFAGNPDHHYLIMKQDHILIGLFEGMFEQNILTFNPGWDQDAQTLPEFDDVRAIQAALLAQGLQLERRVEPGTEGPASIVLIDPDGNPVLIDQHV